ncbi:unnamed protein product [Cladocopium goreaui]|uniref:Chloride channel protein n=1 Tax=Cladocopium goreaui TaxID=2562237 RepID=A0A9P1D1B0_9DINO|nr:unnamed protein product [Cladocopium goreaui]
MGKVTLDDRCTSSVASCHNGLVHWEQQAARREMISVACAAGFSAGFGTPLGGVLWSFELSGLEVTGCSQFPQQTLISAFLADIVADLVEGIKGRQHFLRCSF